MEYKRLKVIYKYALWLAVFMWMIWIFSLSAQTASESKTLSGQAIRLVAETLVPEFTELSPEEQTRAISAWQHRARKTAHVLLYFGLGSLCMLALLHHTLNLRRKFFIAISIAFGYAVFDEFHQLFVDGRGSQLSDIFIDLAGALVGITMITLINYWRVIRRNKKLPR